MTEGRWLPKEPSREMVIAARNYWLCGDVPRSSTISGEDIVEIYRAMYEAAEPVNAGLQGEATLQRIMDHCGLPLTPAAPVPDDDFGLTAKVLKKILDEAWKKDVKENEFIAVSLHDHYEHICTGILKVVRGHINAAPQVPDGAGKPGMTPIPSSAVSAPSDGWTSDPPDAGSLPVASKGEA